MTDALLAPLLAAVNLATGQLPVGTAPNLPALEPLWALLAGLDSLIPIMGPLAFMTALLGLVVVFVVVRLVLTVWNLIWP